MKTKLLKETRKRFSIIKIEELPSNPLQVDLKRNSKFGLPYYIVKDSYDSSNNINGMFDHYFPFHNVYKTYDEAYNGLKNLIVSTYSEKFRHKDGKETKIWWK